MFITEARFFSLFVLLCVMLSQPSYPFQFSIECVILFMTAAAAEKRGERETLGKT